MFMTWTQSLSRTPLLLVVLWNHSLTLPPSNPLSLISGISIHLCWWWFFEAKQKLFYPKKWVILDRRSWASYFLVCSNQTNVLIFHFPIKCCNLPLLGEEIVGFLWSPWQKHMLCLSMNAANAFELQTCMQLGRQWIRSPLLHQWLEVGLLPRKNTSTVGSSHLLSEAFSH